MRSVWRPGRATYKSRIPTRILSGLRAISPYVSRDLGGYISWIFFGGNKIIFPEDIIRQILGWPNVAVALSALGKQPCLNPLTEAPEADYYEPLRKPVRVVTLLPTVSHRSFQLGPERHVGTENKVPGRAWNGAAQPVPLGSTRQTLLVENEKLTTCIGFSGSRFTFWGRSLEHFHDYES